MMKVFCNLMEVVVIRACALVRTHSTVHLEWVQFILCKLSCNIIAFKRKKMDALVTEVVSPGRPQ